MRVLTDPGGLREVEDTPEAEASAFAVRLPPGMEPDSLTIVILLVTPDLAKLWLERNTRNRPLSLHKAEAFARDMGANKWTLGSSCIAFAPDGTLMNGQHRLHSCIMSGRPFPAIIIFNLSAKNFHNMDAAPGRTRPDRLALDDHKYRNTLAGAMGYVAAWEQNSQGNKVGLTATEERELLDRHPQLIDSVAFIREVPSTLGLHSIFSAYHYICSKADPMRADHFFETLSTGAGMLTTKDPVYLLYRQLSDDKRNTTKKMLMQKKLALIIKAWNYTFEGRRVSVLRWSQGEGFPEISGIERE